jgi:hypothetical protein
MGLCDSEKAEHADIRDILFTSEKYPKCAYFARVEACTLFYDFARSLVLRGAPRLSVITLLLYGRADIRL